MYNCYVVRQIHPIIFCILNISIVRKLQTNTEMKNLLNLNIKS